MRRSVWLTVLVILFLLAAAYLTDRYEISSAETVGVPAPAPVTGAISGEQAGNTLSEDDSIDFTLSDLNGDPVSLSDYRGKVVYVNFWATWCKWCKKEMPDMEAIHQAYSGLGLVILAVSVGEEMEKVAQFIEENQYTFQTLLDPDKAVAQAYGVKPIPVSIFIDRNGHVAYRKLGYMDEERMREQIDILISS